MEDDGNPDHDIELVVAQDGTGNFPEEALLDQVGSVNSTSTLEILIDGSELLNEGIRNEGLELSITFEKTHEAEGQHSELADRLDGVEVSISLDRTQAVGAVGLERPDLWVLATETHSQNLPLPSSGDMENGDATGNTLSALDHGNRIVEIDAVMEGDDSQLSEKKRSREEMAEEGRCLKLKTMEVSGKELQDTSKSIAAGVEHVDDVHVVAAQHMESSKLAEELDINENKCEIIYDSMRQMNTEQNIVMDGTANECKEACIGQGADDKQCFNGSTELASLHSKVDNNERTVEEGGRTRHPKKRKVAMLLAYCGAGYQGMQKNPGAVTIEGLLEEALSKAGAVPENYDGNPRKLDWMRAARTDKGVSAVGQVVSGLFYIDPPGFVERVNAHLPQQIRLLGYKRVIPTFSAKKYCDRRRYEYVIPIFALDPSTHRDREAVLASEGKEDAFIKCQECSDRGRKIPAGRVFKKPSLNKEETDICEGQSATSESPSTDIGTYGMTTDIGISTTSTAEDQPHQDATSGEPKEPANLEVADLAPIEEEKVKQGSISATSDPKKEPFHFGDAERARLNRILNYYVGTHNFHNFTSRVKAQDPSAKRYMVSFESGDVFTVGNTEFVRCTVVGQSFMLHQIRKMIGLAIAVFRGFTPESMLETALRRDINITIPTAPELGLFLDECMYPAYNQKWYNTHEEVSQKGHEHEINSFKHDVIYEHIAATEYKEGQMALFLHSLNDRNYADLASAREAAAKLVTS